LRLLIIRPWVGRQISVVSSFKGEIILDDANRRRGGEVCPSVAPASLRTVTSTAPNALQGGPELARGEVQSAD
jgi:hypothetical protein